MKEKFKLKMNLKNKLVIVFCLLNLISLIIVSVMVYENLYTKAKNDFQTVVKLQLDNADAVINQYTKNTMESLDMLASSDLVSTPDSRITSYIDKKGNNGEVEMNPMKTGGYELDLYRYFEKISKSYSCITEISVALDNNGGFLRYPASARKDGYNPKERDWYKACISSNNKFSFTDAYKASNGEVAILCLTALRDPNNKIKGVMNVGISLNKITELIKSKKIGENGYVVLVDKSGTILAHGKDEKVISKNIKELKIDKLNDLEKINGTTVEVKLPDGNKYKILVEKSINKDLGWTYISFIKSSEFNKVANDMAIRVIIFALISLAIGIGLSIVVAKKISKPISAISRHLKLLGEGDFTKKVESQYIRLEDETGEMAKSVDHMQESIKEMLLKVKDNSQNTGEQAVVLKNSTQQMTHSTVQVAHAIEDVAKGSNEQANDLIQITNIISDFGNEFEGIAKSIHEVQQNAQSVSELAGNSDYKMKNLLDSISSIEGKFKDFSNKIYEFNITVKKVNEITSFINNIAEQTNLLALNAAIEAARAGEYGKGFAVVADEIRDLAEKSKESLNEINILISNVSNDTSIIVSTSSEMSKEMENQKVDINLVVEAVGTITDAITEVIPRIQSINLAAKNMNKKKDDILNKVEGVSSISEEVSAASEEIVASVQDMELSTNKTLDLSKDLNTITKEMLDGVNRFKL